MVINKESTKEPFWSMDKGEVLGALKTNISGLSNEEAVVCLKTFGSNVIDEYRRLGKLEIALRQFKSSLVIILVVSGVVTGFLGEWVETGVIFAAVVANVFFGFWQENKAENVLELLKTYVRARARARRNSEERRILFQNATFLFYILFCLKRNLPKNWSELLFLLLSPVIRFSLLFRFALLQGVFLIITLFLTDS